MPKKSLAKFVNEIRKELLTKSSQRVASISDRTSFQAKPLKVAGKPDASASGGQKRKRA
jgi:hypothetical protein